MNSVLFICTANRFRSPIAEAYFKKLLQEQKIESQWKVGSAGTWTQAGYPVLPSDMWIKENLGLDLSKHRSISVNKKLLSEFNLVLVMESNQKEAMTIEFPDASQKIFMLTELTGGPVYDIPDPVMRTDEDYLNIAIEIGKIINKSFQKIYKRGADTQ